MDNNKQFTAFAQEAKRIGQRGMLPASTKYNILNQYNPTNNSVEYKDRDGVVVFGINLTTGVLTFSQPLNIGVVTTFLAAVNFNSTVTMSSSLTLGGITVSAPVKETQMYLVSGGTGGGAAIATSRSYYTDSTTMVTMPASRFQINPADYPGCTFLLEAVYRAGALADATRTMSLELYDVAAASVVTNSTISGDTKADDTPVATTIFPRLRGSTNFRGNLTTGNRDYILRYKTDTATRFVDVYAAKLIIQY